MFHLLDCILFTIEGWLADSSSLEHSREAELVLAKICELVVKGLKIGLLQKNLHLVLLSIHIYGHELKSVLAQWMMVWISSKSHAGISDQQILKFLCSTPMKGIQLVLVQPLRLI